MDSELLKYSFKHHTLCNQHIQQNVAMSQSCICMQIFVVLSLKKQRTSFQGPKESELPQNHIYQRCCVTCLIKKGCLLKSSGIMYMFILRMSTSECLLLGEIFQTYGRKLDVDRNSVKNIYVKLLVYLQLMSSQMWELGTFWAGCTSKQKNPAI